MNISKRRRRLHRKITDFSTTILEAGNQWKKILKTLREKYFPTYPIRNQTTKCKHKTNKQKDVFLCASCQQM